MPLTLANTERGTIAIPCPKCNALLEAILDKFTQATDYSLGIGCAVCHAQFTVRIVPEPMLAVPESDVCTTCDGSGEVSGNHFAEDGMETCPDCGGKGNGVVQR